MKTISINCSCCGGREADPVYENLVSVYTEKPYDVVRCRSCSNIITLPVIGKNELAKIYSDTYLYPVHLLAMGEKKHRARAMAAYMRKQAPSSGKRMLEIGCMFGFLLDEMKSDHDVRGIEIGNEAVVYCRVKGLNVEDISVEEYLQKSAEKFDSIVISHVLEHLLDPAETLQKMKEHLNPGGTVYILVPNHRSISAKIFGRYWGWWQVPVHINHFNENALTQLARRSGYQVVGKRTRGGDSLMLLLNLVNLFHFKNEHKSPGFFQKMVIGVFTSFFRYWYLAGNEELTVELKVI